MSGSEALYLVWHGADDTEVSLGEPNHVMQPGLMMVRSERTRSKLYHAVKRQLPKDAALLVAPLSDAPKFKGMSPGSMKWVEGGS